MTMRVERFFSTLLEEKASISHDAAKMILDEEYISFFMTCGPNYVRSLNRAQEVTSIFSFHAKDAYSAQAFADSLRLMVYGNYQGSKIQNITTAAANKTDNSLKYFNEFQTMDMNKNKPGFDDENIMESLSIEILGYGLGLNKSGSETLVSTSLDEFNEVMKFAFESMTKTGYNTGMISKVEVTPWADNAEFLQYANVDYYRILVPKPRGLIENARKITQLNGQVGFACMSSSSIADDFGKCCKTNEIVKISNYDELGRKVTTKRCEPRHYLSPVAMKDNLETNAEFVALLSSVAQDKVKSLSTLGQCVNALRAFPSRFDYSFLQSTDKATYDGAIEMVYTVKELKAALDPAANLGILSMIGSENDEYFEMFYQPCLSALYGAKKDNNKRADPKYFMSEPWYNIEECTRPSCLEADKAWDRRTGNGCVDGLLARQSSFDPIPVEEDQYCSRDMNQNGTESCKYKYTPHANVVMQMDNCRASLPQGKDGRGKSVELSMSYLMDYFCMPKLFVGNEADSNKMDEVDNSWEICVSILSHVVISFLYIDVYSPFLLLQ